MPWKASKIRENIFIGNQLDAHSLLDLKDHQITHILNVADDVSNKFDDSFVYCSLDVLDYGKDIGISRVFETAFQFVDEAFSSSEHSKILIHCRKGINRSVTITIAILMKREGLTLKQAWEEIKNIRKIAFPQKDNREELIIFEKELFGCNSLSNCRAFY